MTCAIVSNWYFLSTTDLCDPPLFVDHPQLHKLVSCEVRCRNDCTCNIVIHQKCTSLTKVPQRMLQTIISTLVWIQRQGMWCCDEVWGVNEGDNCSKREKRDNYIKRKSKKGKRLNDKRTRGLLNELSLLYPPFTCFPLLSLEF